MEYREADPREFGFEDSEEANLYLREFVQHVMARAEPNDIMDSLLIMANIADIQAISAITKDRRTWYLQLGTMSRHLLESLGRPNMAQADIALEDPTLYFPEATGSTH